MLQSLFDYPWFLAFGLFFPLFIALELGWQLSWRTQVNSDTDNHEQIGKLRDALLLLLTFVVGFTCYGPEPLRYARSTFGR